MQIAENGQISQRQFSAGSLAARWKILPGRIHSGGNQRSDSAPDGACTSRTQPEGVLISVIIPTYNYAHLLPRALDSVVEQLATDVELIVVNDGSTDATRKCWRDTPLVIHNCG
jgi:cellulose synthase/poly-beta-1,6-N-acetylglucosamine synthase-like glycosyltransferase